MMDCMRLARGSSMLVSLALCLACSPSPGRTNVGSSAEPSLRGLSEVVFTVSVFGSRNRPTLLGIDGELRGAGLRLLSEDEVGHRAPHLDLYLTVACNGASCGYTTRLELSEPVRPARSPDTEGIAVTWQNGYQHAIAATDLPGVDDLLESDARALVKDFLAKLAADNRSK